MSLFMDDLEDLRRCFVCEKHFNKDDMQRVAFDEPGAYEWVCEECAMTLAEMNADFSEAQRGAEELEG